MKKGWIFALFCVCLLLCTAIVSAQDELSGSDVESYDNYSLMSLPNLSDVWTCENGHTGNTGKFCATCGAPKPEPKDDSWTCENGHSGNTGKFCTECGAPKPVDDGTWTCVNGHSGNTGKFCSECGAPKQSGENNTQPPSKDPEVTRVPLTFERGTEEDQIKKINAVLSEFGLLSDLELDEIEDYLSITTTRDAAGQITAREFHLGFDSLTLVCTKDENEPQHAFRIDVEVYPRSDNMNIDRFKAAWLKSHPGCVNWTVWHISYDRSEADAFIMVYYKGSSVNNLDTVPDGLS